MRLHHNFEWDEEKARDNVKKHGVTFEDASLVLSDDAGDSFHVEEFDVRHSDDEDRYVTTASHPEDRGLVFIIAWTDRSTPRARVTRIISARLATPAERKAYVKEIGHR